MAKRRRLEPARLEGASPVPPAMMPAELGTKSMLPSYPLGIAPTRGAPIADVAGDASMVAALHELSQSLTSARAEGRLILRISLAEVHTGYLVRDRIALDPAEMTALCDSLRARGQQTAIEVVDLGESHQNGRWGLISGWRRVQALRQLHKQGAGIDTVLAVVRAPRDAADAYLSMVEENEIRIGLSYYERARIVARAVDLGVYASDKAGLVALFAAASRPKRSKIGSFVRIVRALDDHLRFPAALNERTGLALAGALDADARLADRLAIALGATAPTSVQAEAEVIAQILRTGPALPKTLPSKLEQMSEPQPDPETKHPSMQTAPIGLEVISERADRLVLQGPAVADMHFRRQLMRWLVEENRL